MYWWKRYNLDNVVGPDYSELKYRGHGSNGVVFRAFSHAREELVAIKFVHIPKRDMNTRNRFEAEVAAMERLKGERTVKIYNSNMAADPPYIVMEWLPLGNLRERLDKKLRPLTLLNLFLETCHCVYHCHQNEVTHRDIKPENVLFRSQKRPILSDFGICKIESASLGTSVKEMQRRGTVLYMAPEQRKRDLIQSKPADIFALGIMVHFDINEKIKNRQLKASIEGLAGDCCMNDAAKRPSIETVIEQLEQSIEVAEQYRNNRIKVRHIMRLTEEMVQRVKSEKEALISMESPYLLERMKQFNSIAEGENSEKYHTSLNWHLDEEFPYYAPQEFTTNYLRHKKGEISIVEEKELLLNEASEFLSFMRKHLRES